MIGLVIEWTEMMFIDNVVGAVTVFDRETSRILMNECYLFKSVKELMVFINKKFFANRRFEWGRFKYELTNGHQMIYGKGKDLGK